MTVRSSGYSGKDRGCDIDPFFIVSCWLSLFHIIPDQVKEKDCGFGKRH